MVADYVNICFRSLPWLPCWQCCHLYRNNNNNHEWRSISKGERRTIIFKNLKNRRHSWIGHIIRYNAFVVNVLDGAISGKKAVGRPRLQNLKQVHRNTGAESYTTMKRMACNNSRWKVIEKNIQKNKSSWPTKVIAIGSPFGSVTLVQPVWRM
jgi:hypothetical protein